MLQGPPSPPAADLGLALPHLERDGGEGDLVVEVVEAAARLLQLELDAVELGLHAPARR